MHSILLQIGSLPPLRSYGLCMALGFLLGWLAAVRLGKRVGQSSDSLASLLTWLMVASIFGARLAYVIEHWSSEFARNPMAVLRVDQGGLMFYGGLIMAALTLALYAHIHRQRLLELTDLILAVLPLGHAFGRVGCFLHGCCYGKITTAWYGVRFPKESPAWWEQATATPPLIGRDALHSLPVIPTQLIEAGANALLFAALFSLYARRHRQRGFITGCYLIGYATLRFSVEGLRGDPRLALGPLSIGQCISLGLFAIGCFCLARSRKIPAQLERKGNHAT